ncbi:hypothetical protein RHGRI_001749 [Rhododendron griersonianum]|uniref:Reticulon-like protein n=1 Tax=Rhododendron griersonianum TaxID=479676 RepID=A0AAV6LL97_9ERIC|nr:hypothetical protein RHGRI_001749 [Rhododendron griersonianum]
MADHSEISDPKGESLMEKIADKLNVDDSSSSDSDSAKKPASSPPSVKPKATPSTSSMKAKIYRMFGREKPVHKVFGGGKRVYVLESAFGEMADHVEISDSKGESLMEKIAGKLNVDNLSSSDSDSAKKPASSPPSVKPKTTSPTLSMKAKIYRMFGREKPVQKVSCGKKPADIFLWRNKKISAGVLGAATAMWVLFELLEYHLLTLVCHLLILALAILFLWSNASKFINKSPPRIPEVHLPEEQFLEFASALRIEINRALVVLRDIASGRDLKKFVAVIAGLWVLSLLGSCCNFLTLFYIAFVLLHTVPVLYEKYEDQIDPLAEKAMMEIKKQYAVFDEKVLSKIPRGALKDKKRA